VPLDPRSIPYDALARISRNTGTSSVLE
jgi:hypothetical protein